MSKKLCFVVIGLFVLLIMGCSDGIKDKPLPMSQENLEKFALELNKAGKSVVFVPSQNRTEQLVGLYKEVLEKNMGYSFDKTFRSVVLFYNVGKPWQLMSPVITYIHDDLERALDKGFISQRTFDILSAAKKTNELTKENKEFLNFVLECQNKNSGACDSKSLLQVFATHNVLSTEKRQLENLEDKLADLEDKYGLFYMSGYLMKPNGEKVKPYDVISQRNPNYKFVINKDKVALSQRLSTMLTEERKQLSE